MDWFVRKKRGNPPSPAFEGQREIEEEADWGIIGLENRGDGAPTSIVVKGPVKCVICEGFTEDRLICVECAEAVTFLRAADNLQNFRELIKFVTRPGTLAVLKLLTDDALTDIMMKRIDDARNRA